MNRIAAARGAFNAFSSISCMLIVKRIWTCHMEFALYKLIIIIIIIITEMAGRSILLFFGCVLRFSSSVLPLFRRVRAAQESLFSFLFFSFFLSFFFFLGGDAFCMASLFQKKGEDSITVHPSYMCTLLFFSVGFSTSDLYSMCEDVSSSLLTHLTA